MMVDRVAKMPVELHTRLVAAVCRICGQAMADRVGCIDGRFLLGTREQANFYDRVRLSALEAPAGMCRGCGAAPGQFHHWRCAAETCPKCGEPFADCVDLQEMRDAPIWRRAR